MKRIIFLNILLLSSVLVHAQQRFGNEWINFNQQYLKITVSQDGIYRVTGLQLKNAGWNTANISPTKLQMFYMGTEMNILVNSANSTSISDSDFIEFYGIQNRGDLDSLLYRPMSARTNPYYSLYTDDSHYFLTYGTTNGKRSSVYQSPASSQNAELYHLEEEVKVFATQNASNFSGGFIPYVSQSFYEAGTGRTGPLLLSDTTSNTQISFINRYPSAGINPKVSVRLNGRSNNSKSLKVGFNNGTSLNTVSFSGFGTVDVTDQEIFPAGISSEKTNITVQTAMNQTPNSDFYSFNYIKFIYPQFYYTGTGTYKYFNLLTNNQNKSKISLSGIVPTALYDITDKYSPIKILPSTTSVYEVPNTLVKRKIFTVPNISSVTKIASVSFTNFNNIAIPNYLIITDPLLDSSMTVYANYRKSAAGGSYKTFTTYTQDLYNQFTYGSNYPFAITRYCDLMLTKNTDLNLLLVGRGVTYSENLKRQYAANIPLVPGTGFPGSDALLTAGLNNNDLDVLAIPTGRLSFYNNNEVMNYLNKVIEHESLSGEQSWRKNVLHLSGGKTTSEVTYLAGILSGLTTLVNNSIFSGNLYSFKKQNPAAATEIVNITSQINTGVSLLSYIGHGSTTGIEFDFGYASDATKGYNNKGKYGMMLFDGCGVSNVYSMIPNLLSTNWLITPNKGSIAIIGNSYNSWGYSTNEFYHDFYDVVFNNPLTINKTIGQQYKEAIKTLIPQKSNPYILTLFHQMILQGDPVLKIFPTGMPDYAIKNHNLYVSTKAGINGCDSLVFTTVIKNYGRYSATEKINANINFKKNSTLLGTVKLNLKAIANSDSLQFVFVKNKDITSIELVLDPDNIIPEFSDVNNTASIALPTFVSSCTQGIGYSSTITACDVLEPNNSFIAATVVNSSNYLSPDICFDNASDVDWFKWIAFGKVYYIKCYPANASNYSLGRYKLKIEDINGVLNLTTLPVSGATPYTDTVIELYDSNGVLKLSTNDQSVVNNFSKITFSLPKPCSVIVNLNSSVFDINAGSNNYMGIYMYASNKLSSVSRVQYKGQNSVILQPGFEAKFNTGGMFKAEIKNCGY